MTDFSATMGKVGQDFCKNLSPDSRYREVYLAMVCGVSLSGGDVHLDLRRTGLLHLFVVSGSHLIFFMTILEYILEPLRARRRHMGNVLGGVILMGYAVLSGLSPPVVRALVAMVVSFANLKQKFFWSRIDEVFYSGLFCLVVFPTWWTSLSFQLSWLASLGLALGPTALLRCLYIYLLLLIPLSGLGIAHPLTIVFNWLLGPVLGFILLPLSLLAFLIPPLTAGVDFFWQIFLVFLSDLARSVSDPQVWGSPSRWSSWLLLIALHIGLREWHRYQIRKRWRQ